MSTGSLILCLVMELSWLYLTPAASEVVVMGFLGQSVTLPCVYSSWSPSSNSMCWGKGPCPNSRCKQVLLHTDGKAVTSGKSAKYGLQGNIQQGDVSLTISNTNDGDRGVYCCRIEVPGWFNDVKKNIRLVLRRAPTTTVKTTTTSCTTTSRHVVTTTEVLPTTVTTTPDLTTGTPLQTGATSVRTTVGTVYPLTAPSAPPEATTGLLTTETTTEGSHLPAESETFFLSTDFQRSTDETSTDTALLSSKASKVWILPFTSPVVMWKVNETVTSQPRASEVQMAGHSSGVLNQTTVHLIVASCLGFVLFLALLLAFFLRGKVMKTNCLQKHKRLDDTGESKTVLSDMQQGRDDEEGLFTL